MTHHPQEVSFDTAEERQANAESHHLWPKFMKYWHSHYSESAPDMMECEARSIFQSYIQGAYDAFDK